MVKKPGSGQTQPIRTYTDLTEHQVKSLSRAEWIATRLFVKLEINSFNGLMLSLPVDAEADGFRPIFCFVTRESDLAVAELNLLYVVEDEPGWTIEEINRVWPSRKIADLTSHEHEMAAST
jgi:hypothetical protein